jgi:hypothetical protein
VVKKQKQRELFIGLLEENRSIIRLNGLSKFYLICNSLAQRDFKRFMAVDERDRKEIFQDYIEEIFEDEIEKTNKRQKDNIIAIKELL